jgi:FkbM family methyltransferase
MSLATRAYLWGRSLRIRTARRMRGDFEYKLLPMLVRAGLEAIDVGANRGVYTIPMAARAKHVWAYEPNPWIAGYLANGVPANVTVKNLAVSDQPGTITLRVPLRPDGQLSHNQGSVEAIERFNDVKTVSADIKAVKLDDEKFGPVGFMKIDVEDHELPVIRGARNLIARDRPNMLVEVIGFAGNPRWLPLYDELRGLDYEAYVFLDGALAPAAQIDEKTKGKVGLNVVFLPVNRKPH